MGKNEYEKSYGRQIESIVIAISSVYYMTELVLGYKNNWNPWGQLAVLAGLIVSGIYFFGKYKSFEKRAHITCFASQILIVVYGVECGDFYLILSLFISLCILLGLYGVPRAMLYPFLSYSFLVYYYIVVKEQLVWGAYTSDLGMITRVLQGYLTLFLVVYLVYRYKVSQESMLEMIDALRKSERQKDDFLANVSHEIRTPINTICGVSEIMLKNNVPIEMKEDVLNIQSAGRNLMSVVGDILDYSELQEGEFELIEENYNITSTIYDIINMSMAKKSEKGLELIVDCDATMPAILIGDEQKIRRVIMNLVNNAIEFTNEGCVTLRFGYRKEDYGINLIITVADTGIGMGKESVEKLFKKFSQVDMGRTRKKGGVGLGLAIAQALVNKMGGFITVKSELGKGSEFSIIIPQKVYKERPIIEFPEKNAVNAAVYINMDQLKHGVVRQQYGEMLSHVIEQLHVRCHVCRNLQELKRWEKREGFNHIFISYMEYQEDPIYFDRLASRNNVYIILDHFDDAKIQNKHLNKIYKPFFVLSIVSALKSVSQSELQTQNEEVEIDNQELYAPDAKVLIIDDNRMNIRVVEGLMKVYGVQVSYALSGQEGIEKLEEDQYDLVFLDHMMPGMDGVETFHQIRRKQDVYFKEVPIVALTANAIAGAREKFLKEGFNDFLSKPVESSVLQRSLKKYIPKEKQLKRDEPVSEKEIVSAIVEEEILPITEKFVIDDLDIAKGLMYCGNKENYLEILASQRDSGKETLKQAQTTYAKADWKNYIIIVHGIKSAMMSIGAVKLSEMAKGLEFAGKGEDYGYIHENHERMVNEYNRIMKVLENCSYLESKEEEELLIEKPEISKDEFELKLVELENATYEFDGVKMFPILDFLSEFSYQGKDMAKELKPVYKKIEMFDFMSAYEAVVKIKEVDKC